MAIPGDVNRVSFCLPGFPIGSLLFFHFWTLFFGSKSLSLAHTQEEEDVWGIKFSLPGRGSIYLLSVYIYVWKSFVRKFYLLFLICLFIHSFMLVWTHLHLFCTLDCNSLPCFLFCCLNFSSFVVGSSFRLASEYLWHSSIFCVWAFWHHKMLWAPRIFVLL